MGWYTIASFDRDPFFVITDNINKNLNLYAKWVEVKTKELKTIGIVTMEDLLEELVGDIDESNEGGESHD